MNTKTAMHLKYTFNNYFRLHTNAQSRKKDSPSLRIIFSIFGYARFLKISLDIRRKGSKSVFSASGVFGSQIYFDCIGTVEILVTSPAFCDLLY